MRHHNSEKRTLKKYETYDDFLKIKERIIIDSGFDTDDLNENLFDFQRDIVKWALRKGKAALFEDTGLGKTIQQLAWADAVAKHEHGKVLILAPLAVSKQTSFEAEKFGISCKLCETQADVQDGINITNYEKLHKFDTSQFCGVVLDESSIIKSYAGKTTSEMIDKFRFTPYKLACTATPSPNDYTELGNHAEFLNVMTMNEMLSMFFINDSSNGIGWRLKGHSVKDFFKWIGEWAIMIKTPGDLGFDAAKYNLPPLNIKNVVVESPLPDDQLFAMPASTLQERRQARKDSLETRVKKAVEIADDNEPVLIWCNYNDESELLTKELKKKYPESITYEIKGNDTDEHKENGLVEFSKGKINYLVSKPSICGFGMNWQNCHKMIFCGLSDSYEQFYQAVRRCYRFGQKKPVEVYVITSEAESSVLANVQNKQKQHEQMSEEMLSLINDITKEKLYSLSSKHTSYIPQETMRVPKWL